MNGNILIIQLINCRIILTLLYLIMQCQIRPVLYSLLWILLTVLSHLKVKLWNPVIHHQLYILLMLVGKMILFADVAGGIHCPQPDSLIGTILQSQSAFLHLCIGVVFCQRKSMPRPSCICGIFYKCNATHRILICCLNLIIFTHIPYIIRRSLLITPPAIILYCNQLWLLLVDSHGKGMHLANAFC